MTEQLLIISQLSIVSLDHYHWCSERKDILWPSNFQVLCLMCSTNRNPQWGRNMHIAYGRPLRFFSLLWT